MTTIQQKATETGQHLIRRGNVYLSLGVVITIIAATVWVTQEVERMRSTIEWNTKQVSRLLLEDEQVVDFRVRLKVLEHDVRELKEE